MIGLRILLSGVGLAVILTAASIVPASSVRAQPEITESNVQDGDVLDTPPEVFRLCFSEPVDTSDQPSGDSNDGTDSPWEFNVTAPDGRSLGLRIVFQSDGECVDVEPGIPEEPPDGIWLFDWTVRSQATGEESSGALTFRVGPGDPPVTVDPGSDDDDTTTYVIAGVLAGVGVLAVITAGVVAVRRRRTRIESGDS